MEESTNDVSSIHRIDAGHPETAATTTPATLSKMDGPPMGLRRESVDGTELVDAVGGRASAFGFGFGPHLNAITGAAARYLGDALANEVPASIEVTEEGQASEDDDNALQMELRNYLADSNALELTSIFLCSSADMAVEKAIEIVRTGEPTSRYRTIALAGSDHGRTGVCRTASGCPALHERFGPLMAGFGHVPPGDIDALRQSIDEQTAAVLLCPVDLDDAARPLAGDYLTAVRQLCDEHDLLLIFDESRLCIGSAATPLVFSSVAEVQADAVILGAGLFGGLPGGILLAGTRATPSPAVDTRRYPLLFDLAVATLAEVNGKQVLATVAETATDLAVQVAESIGEFEFIRDVHATGMTIGIETDVQSSELVRAAARHGLRIEAAGDTSIRIQCPLVITDSDREKLIQGLAATMDSCRREFSDLVVS